MVHSVVEPRMNCTATATTSKNRGALLHAAPITVRRPPPWSGENITVGHAVARAAPMLFRGKGEHVDAPPGALQAAAASVGAAATARAAAAGAAARTAHSFTSSFVQTPLQTAVGSPRQPPPPLRPLVLARAAINPSNPPLTTTTTETDIPRWHMATRRSLPRRDTWGRAADPVQQSAGAPPHGGPPLGSPAHTDSELLRSLATAPKKMHRGRSSSPRRENAVVGDDSLLTQEMALRMPGLREEARTAKHGGGGLLTRGRSHPAEQSGGTTLHQQHVPFTGPFDALEKASPGPGMPFPELPRLTMGRVLSPPHDGATSTTTSTTATTCRQQATSWADQQQGLSSAVRVC